MKIKENVTVYQCEHCKRKMFVKSAMERHEKYCEKNPDNFKACSVCKYIKSARIEYYTENDEARVANGFKCTKLNRILYPTKAERKGLPEKYPETFEGQYPMPNECEHFEDLYGDEWWDYEL